MEVLIKTLVNISECYQVIAASELEDNILEFSSTRIEIITMKNRNNSNSHNKQVKKHKASLSIYNQQDGNEEDDDDEVDSENEGFQEKSVIKGVRVSSSVSCWNKKSVTAARDKKQIQAIKKYFAKLKV